MRAYDGVIFDIKRFAIHDGRGLRTTLFLKGCPLDCPWCQNPEGKELRAQIWNDPVNCLKCGSCLQGCPHEALSLTDRIHVSSVACAVCGSCVDACPSGAMKRIGETVSARQAAEMLLRDRVFFQKDGGITLSGGEVLSQWRFALEILKICHESGIDTAVETSLYAARSVIEALLPVTDHFLIDIKYVDRELHKMVIGVDNSIILDNYRYLVQQGADVLVRTPLIPGFTATEKNIESIARFLYAIDPDAKYELLNFNPLCRSKYAALEQDYPVSGPAFTKEEVDCFYDVVRRAGLIRNKECESMLQTFLSEAKRDMPVFLGDVRRAFQKTGTRPFYIHVHSFQEEVRVFALMLPETGEQEEDAFVAAYIHAYLYNILSALGAVRIEIYLDPEDRKLWTIAENLRSVFQLDLPKAERMGYGKCINVNERILRALTENSDSFAIRILEINAEPVRRPLEKVMPQGQVFVDLPQGARTRILLGVDIGGTDIKLAVSIHGTLAFCKEYDWFPTGFSDVEQFIDPVVMLIRLMRAAVSAKLAGVEEKLDLAMERDADLARMEQCCMLAETALGDAICRFDAIGISFPDVVIRNRIVGGETFKTRGMRNNPDRNYEEQFAKITELGSCLRPFVVEDDRVMITNDGHIAAFTVAVEQASTGEDCAQGLFAHTLGTELGSGWVEGDGLIPEIPLEVYNFIIDLGSFDQRTFEADDVRSVSNFNTQLPGTLQKYTSQYGAFRLAAKYAPTEAPEIWRMMFSKGLFQWDGEKLIVPTEPRDMRKPCLEYLMEKAAEGDALCSRIFREIGEYLSMTWEETMHILRPDATERTLFGRLVKVPECFDLICEGARSRTPEMVQHAADGGLANTDLMKQLEAHPHYTVAQFAQAIGAIYFGCLACLDGQERKRKDS